jgi:hypothetical protein
MDARGIPTCECPNCGGIWFKLNVIFNPKTYTIGEYSRDMECIDCKTIATSPTPPDKPKDID